MFQSTIKIIIKYLQSVQITLKHTLFEFKGRKLHSPEAMEYVII